MRVLVSFAGGEGHLRPLLPVVRALSARGHEVLVACQPGALPVVAREGLRGVDTGGPTLLAPGRRRAPGPVDRAAELRVVREVFAGRVARERAGRVRELARAWGADVVVRDELDLGALVAAEALGLPHAAVVVIAAGGFLRPEVLRAPVDALRSEHGLGPDPELTALHRHLTLVPVPPSFRDPSDPLPATALAVRPSVLERPELHGGSVDEPGGAPGGPHRPRLLVTLGTVFDRESGDLFARVVAGVAALDADVVVALGRDLVPAELGPQPAHVRVEGFVPLDRELPGCDLLVCHGGSGSVVAALALGVPVLVLPMGADQPLTGDRCTALGVGRVLDPLAVTPAEVRAAAAGVMADPGVRRTVAGLAAEAAALPGAARAADLVEALAR